MIIQAEGLEVTYGSALALRGVDFTLTQGEGVALMGRNGMGKTTLIKALMGLLPLRAGRVNLMGRDMSTAAPHDAARCGLAYVPEGRGIFPTLSVAENLRIAGAPGAGPWTLKRIEEMFPVLVDRRALPGDRLSGGEQQMLAIGRALLANPKAIILDEATEGLAPLMRAQIWQVIADIRKEGVAVVVVDKDVKRLCQTMDRAVILSKGQVALEATCLELQAQPEKAASWLALGEQNV